MGDDVADAKSGKAVMERVGWNDKFSEQNANMDKSHADDPSKESAQKEFRESGLSFAFEDDEMVKEITGD